MKVGELYELTKEDIEYLKSIKFMEASPQTLEIIRLSKE